MQRALRWNRDLSQTWLGRLLCTGLAADSALLGCLPFLAVALAGCPGPLLPTAGLPEYQEVDVLAVPGPARVNVAGGNLLVARSDLDLDTQLGPFSVGAVWNSATHRWTWSFDDLSYTGGIFVDRTGGTSDLSSLAHGAAIPGTVWVKMGQYGDGLPGGNTLKTKGGLEYDFTTSGHPLYVHWTSSYSPYLRFSQTFQGDGKLHTTAIDQCLAPAGDCHPVFTIAYDAAGRVSQIGDRAGRQALFGYDASGNLTSARDGLDVAQGWPGFRYEYTGSDLTAITSSEGERVQYQYDGAHRVIQVAQIGLGNPTRTLVYQAPDSGGLYVTNYTDPLGNATSFRYDGLAELFEVKAAGSGDKISRTWASRRVTSLTQPSGVVTAWSYSNDDVQTRSDPSGNVTTYAYQPGGVDRTAPERRPLLSATDSLGTVEQRSYDGAGRLLSTANGAGDTTSLSYGADEMVSQTTDAAGVATALGGYGEHGHATSVTRGGIARSFGYDAVGNLTAGPEITSESGPGLGGIASRSFDADRNVSAVQLTDLATYLPQESDTLAIQYRSDHRRVRVQRPGGGDTQLTYDALGRLAQQSERADGTWHATTFSFDAAGRMTGLARPNGMGESWSYDAQGRLLTHTILRNGATENSVGMVWSHGQVAWMLDLISGVETYTYDAAGRPARTVYANRDRADYGWDARSRQVDMQLHRADGTLLRDIGFGYDAANRQSAILDGGVVRVQRSWTGGRPSQTAYGNGLRRSFSYDAALGTPSGSSMSTASGATVESTTTLYNASCTFAQQCVSAQTASYGGVGATSYEQYWLMPLELQNEPLTLTGKRVGASEAQTQGMLNYDLSSNLLFDGFNSFEYNAEANRLLDERDGLGAIVRTYSYDAAGFVTSRGGVPIGWDAAGRIASVGASTWSWDVLGRPVSSTVDGVRTRRLFGGQVEADAAGNPKALDLGEVRIDLAGNATRYRHYDFRGNVKLVTDASGNVVKHYQYTPYGIDQVFGSDADTVSFARGRQVGDLFVIGHRLYDPAAARFLAPDPVFQLVNQYAYTLGNPVQFWDPSGTSPLSTIAWANVDFVTGVLLAGAELTPFGAAVLSILFLAAILSAAFEDNAAMSAGGATAAGAAAGAAGGGGAAGGAAGGGGADGGGAGGGDGGGGGGGGGSGGSIGGGGGSGGGCAPVALASASQASPWLLFALAALELALGLRVQSSRRRAAKTGP